MFSELTFYEARLKANEILSQSSFLVSRGSVQTESEQLVIASIRLTTGETVSRIELYARAKSAFPLSALDWLVQSARARVEGKPLQYLTGVQEFLSHEYEVGTGVLIPRPETEMLVLTALEYLKEPTLGIEIGLGSGVISVELVSRLRHLKMVASEVSLEAKKYSDKNINNILKISSLTGERIKTVLTSQDADLFEPFEKNLHHCKADFVISNPPYLIQSEAEAEVFLNEPHSALFAPSEDPFYFYRRIAQRAWDFLNPGGWVFLEVPHERASKIMKLFESARWKPQQTKLLNDLTGRPRILLTQKGEVRWTE